MQEEDWKSSLLLIVGLLFALLGQAYLAYRREYVWDAALFWAAGILLLTLVIWRSRRLKRGRRHWQPLSWVAEHPLRTAAATGGMGLSLATGWLARNRPEASGFADLLCLWVVGVAAYLLAFVPALSLPERTWSRLRAWLGENRIGLAGLATLLLLGWGVRAYDAAHIPANLGGDEGTWAMEGLAMLDGRLANPFSTRWFAFPSMSFFVWGLSMRVFGDTVAGLRMVSALVGTASLLATFLLARELWGRRIAWLGAATLAFAHYHLHFSRLAVNNIADSLLVTSALCLLVRGLRSGRPVHFALAGAMVGAGWYAYFGARLVGIIAVLYVTWRTVVESRFLARHGHRLLILLGGALVVVGPLLFHYIAHPSALTEGLDRVGIFASGWLAREQDITGRSAASLLLQQFWKAISAFNYTLDPTFWYHPKIPLLDFVSGVLFVVGLVWTMAHCRWPSNGLLLIWFWLALFLGWVVTENPPSSQRMVGLAPALCLLLGLGVDWLTQITQRVLRFTFHVSRFTVCALLVVIAVLNLRYYFVVYTPTRVYGNPTAEMTTVLGRYLARQDDNHPVYFHVPPFVYWDFGTLRFLARGVKGMDVPAPGEGEAPHVDLSRGARFVFHPERVDELAEIRTRYPGGTETRAHSTADGRLLYVMYEVGPSQQ